MKGGGRQDVHEMAVRIEEERKEDVGGEPPLTPKPPPCSCDLVTWSPEPQSALQLGFKFRA